MSQHIGIVACSAEGAALCYRTICVEGAALLGPHDDANSPLPTLDSTRLRARAALRRATGNDEGPPAGVHGPRR